MTRTLIDELRRGAKLEHRAADEIEFLRAELARAQRQAGEQAGRAGYLDRLIREVINHPLVTAGIEEDENADLLEVVDKARTALSKERS